MQEAALAFPKTHDLALLLDLVLPAEPLWAGLRSSLQMLSEYGVAVRYPGTSTDRAKAKKAIDAARGIISLVSDSLGHPGLPARKRSPKARRKR